MEKYRTKQEKKKKEGFNNYLRRRNSNRKSQPGQNRQPLGNLSSSDPFPFDNEYSTSQEKEKEKENDKEKVKENDKEKMKEKDKDKVKDNEKEKVKDKDKDKVKEKTQKDKDKDKEKVKEKTQKRERSPIGGIKIKSSTPPIAIDITHTVAPPKRANPLKHRRKSAQISLFVSRKRSNTYFAQDAFERYPLSDRGCQRDNTLLNSRDNNKLSLSSSPPKKIVDDNHNVISSAECRLRLSKQDNEEWRMESKHFNNS
eukprot:TRINITY_DN16645_c0_g1_i1.p1 TRINITY_DN16645_c0_g1~~TRINITY_DN16645_c0_g1_i1.p1  ORF type:complete len:256 (+),score=50.64 TRINITY_DN16645_c0_g1_i1:120-887(+)